MISFILLLIAAPLVQTGGAAPTATPAAAPADDETLICKRSVPVGSNIASRKQCFTRRQWDQMARESQALKRSTEQALTTPNM